MQEGIELIDTVLTERNGILRGENGFVNLNKAMFFIVKEELYSEQDKQMTPYSV